MYLFVRKIFPEYKFTKKDIITFENSDESLVGEVSAMIAVKKPGIRKYVNDNGVKKPNVILSIVIDFINGEVQYWEQCNRANCTHQDHDNTRVLTKSLSVEVV